MTGFGASSHTLVLIVAQQTSGSRDMHDLVLQTGSTKQIPGRWAPELTPLCSTGPLNGLSSLV